MGFTLYRQGQSAQKAPSGAEEDHQQTDEQSQSTQPQKDGEIEKHIVRVI